MERSNHWRFPNSFWFRLVTALASLVNVDSQNLPPTKYDGFLYQPNPFGASSSIAIEAFLDPVCPDCRDSWPPLKNALQYYGSHVSLVVHLLPLPYHDNAFAVSRALHIVDLLNCSSTFPLLEQIFKHQEIFNNYQTENMSKVDVTTRIAEFVAEALGYLYYTEMVAGFNDTRTDLKTRVSFKYSASRGVYGTPTFFVNGFALPDTTSTMSFNDWKRVIDPLIEEETAAGSWMAS